MANFADLHDFILPYVPGAEAGIVNMHIRRILRDFFKRTTLWRETFSFVTTTNPSYLFVPTSGAVYSVLSVEANGNLIDPLPENKRMKPAQLSASEPSEPKGWYSPSPGTLSFNPTPTAGNTIVVAAVMTMELTPGITTFPDAAYETYGEEIAAGVIGSLMKMPGKPWSQPKAADDYLGRYVRTTIAARAKLSDGGQPNQSTIHGPTFGR